MPILVVPEVGIGMQSCGQSVACVRCSFVCRSRRGGEAGSTSLLQKKDRVGMVCIQLGRPCHLLCLLRSKWIMGEVVRDRGDVCSRELLRGGVAMAE